MDRGMGSRDLRGVRGEPGLWAGRAGLREQGRRGVQDTKEWSLILPEGVGERADGASAFPGIQLRDQAEMSTGGLSWDRRSFLSWEEGKAATGAPDRGSTRGHLRAFSAWGLGAELTTGQGFSRALGDDHELPAPGRQWD